MHHARMRRTANTRRTFSPEAFGDFAVVEPEQIAQLRERMEARMAEQEWETIEDVVERSDA